MARIFGTDGVRGIANKELTCELAFRLGRAAAIVLSGAMHKRARILIGKDTRISSDMLEAALSAGICSVGADAVLAGTISTPAVASLIRRYKLDAGAVISASHNPFEHNGIKFFSESGHKLPDNVENEIESLLTSDSDIELKYGENIGRIIKVDTAKDDYIDELITATHLGKNSLKGLKVAFDCANGAASATAEQLFSALGVSCLMLSDSPTGININDNCGSTHPQALQSAVIEHRCHLGIAFDGDADRCIAVDENGEIITGDKLIAIFASYFKSKGVLAGNTAVVTCMSNMGFFDFCRKNEINAFSTKVGDRYVLEAMLDGGYVIGGEQSGHIIMTEYSTTGDGQLAALMLLKIIKESKKTLSRLASVMEEFPQVLINVKVDNDKKPLLDSSIAIADAIKSAENSLGNDGRVLVRPSGTEPVVRVMIEGKDKELIHELAQTIAETIRAETSSLLLDV